MCKKQKFLRCAHCGNIVGLIHDAGVPMLCCGEKMQEMEPNTVDAATEKHVPDVTVEGNKVTVQVGSVIHPMEEKHFIMWIYLETKKGGQRKCLSPGEEPKAVFVVEDDEAVAVYEYCNLHGLWKKDL